MKVKVYWNFHKKLFSVQHKGLVVAHNKSLILINPEFRVGEGGRQRVIREESKNVHAYAIGELVEEEKFAKSLQFVIEQFGTEATYDPYKYKTFVRRNDLSPVFNASFAFLNTVNDRAKILIFSPVEANKIFDCEMVYDVPNGEQDNERHASHDGDPEVSQCQASYAVGRAMESSHPLAQR